MVVRGEERLRSSVGIVVEILDDRPGDGDPVIGARPTAQLVEEDEGAWCEGIEDTGGLLHLDHEGRLTP